MSTMVVIGTQWGDEGKGKIVDIISREADVVARYQGGANAGHTVVDGDKKYILHLIPSGILHDSCLCLIGNGVVVDLESLEQEIATLEKLGIAVRNRLFLADGTHLVLPYHRLLDAAQEKLRGKGKIGTTGRGIGCAYGDKVTRQGLRLGDLRSEATVRAKVAAMAEYYEPLFTKVFGIEAPSAQAVADEVMARAPRIVPMLVDGAVWINERAAENKRILIEGAQGVLLDIDHGTYPFVTSSNPTSGGICTGLGLSPKHLGRMSGVTKAYTTRVGEGPLPTEFDEVFGKQIREAGGEFGATTGRPRRCGWFDAVAVRRSVMLCGLDEIMLTKMDVLDGLDKLHIAVAYRINGQEHTVFPSYLDPSSEIDVVYEEMPGWKTQLGQCRVYEDLPLNARRYIERIEHLVGATVSIVSVGADRDGTIMRRPAFF